MQASLRVLKKSGQEGKAFPLKPQQEISVGSSALATMRPPIQDDRFKPVHCIIKVAENGVATVINKAPLCPIQVNKQNVVTSRCLRPWDTISIFDLNLRYENTNTTDEFLQLVNEEQRSFVRSLSKRRISQKLPKRQISLTPNPKKKEVPRIRRSNSFTAPSSSNITMRKSQRIQCANASFVEANISQNCLLPSKVPSTPQVRHGLKVATPSSTAKPTLRNEVMLKCMSTSMGLTTPSGLNLCIKNSGDWEETDSILKTPIADIEKMNFNTPLNNTSIIEIDSPIEESTPMRSRKSQAKNISIKRLTQNDDSIKTPKAVVTPKSALKKSKIMAELLENTKESVFESTMDSDYTVESIHDITNISMNSNRMTPKAVVTPKSALKKSKIMAEHLENTKETVFESTMDSDYTVESLHDITDISMKSNMKTPKAVVTPKSALKNSKIMAELLENTKESVFESTMDSDYTVESLHDITDISMKSNRKTPKAVVTPKSALKKSKIMAEHLENSKESVFESTMDSDYTVESLHDITDISMKSNRKTPEAVTPRSALKKSKIMAELLVNTKESEFESSMDSDHTVENLHDITDISMKSNRKTPKAVVTPKSALKKSKIIVEPLENTGVFKSTIDSDNTVESLHDISDISTKSNRKTPKRSIRGRRSTQSLTFVEESIKELVMPDTQDLENNLNSANIDSKKRKRSPSKDLMNLSKKLRLTRASLSTINSFNVSYPESEDLYSSPLPSISSRKVQTEPKLFRNESFPNLYDSFNSNTSRQSRSKTPKITVNSAKELSKTPKKRVAVLTSAKKSLTLTPANHSSLLSPSEFKTKTPRSTKKVIRTPLSIKKSLTPTNQCSLLSPNEFKTKTPRSMKKVIHTPLSIKKSLGTPRDGTSVNNLSTLGKSSKTPQQERKKNLSSPHGIKKLLKTPRTTKEPKNDLSNPYGVKKLLKTPRTQKGPYNDLSSPRGIKKLLKTPKGQKEPHNDLTSPYGVKKLLKTPRAHKEPKNDLSHPYGVKKLLKTPKQQKEPLNDLTNPHGIKRILRTPRTQNEPLNDLSNPQGVKKLFNIRKAQKEPKNDLSNPLGVKQLMTTRKVQKEPKNDLSNPLGVKQLMTTRKVQKEPKNDLSNPLGVKQLMTTRKFQKEPNNDLSNPLGVKQLMTTRKEQKEPKNDLTNPLGVKKLLRTPRRGKEPLNDLSNPFGVKQLLRTPKAQTEPHNDLSNPLGIKQLLRTPKTQKEPRNDLTNPHGVKKLLRTPKQQKEPLNDLTNPYGIKRILRTPRADEPLNNLTDPGSVEILFKTPIKEPIVQTPDEEQLLFKTPKVPEFSSPMVRRMSKTPTKASPQGVKRPNTQEEMEDTPVKKLFKTVKEGIVSPRLSRTPENYQKQELISPLKRLSVKAKEEIEIVDEKRLPTFITPRSQDDWEQQEIISTSPVKRSSRKILEGMESARLSKTPNFSKTPIIKEEIRNSAKRLSRNAQEMENADSKTPMKQEIAILRLSRTPKGQVSAQEDEIRTASPAKQLSRKSQEIESSYIETARVENTVGSPLKRLSDTPYIKERQEIRIEDKNIEAIKIKPAPAKRTTRKNTKEMDKVENDEVVEVKSITGKRGRRRNPNSTDELENEDVLEEIKSTLIKRTRGNVAKKEIIEQPQKTEELKSTPVKRERRKNTKIDERTVENDEVVKSTPAKRGRRKNMKLTDIENEEEVEEVKSTRAKRGRKNVVDEQNIEEPQETELVNYISEKRKNRKLDVAEVENDNEVIEVKSTPVKRGRRNVAKEENIEVPKEAEAVKSTPAKKGRRKNAKPTNEVESEKEIEEVKSTPVKRGRRNVAKEENIEESEEVKSTLAKRGRRNIAKKENVDELQQTEDLLSKPTKRGTGNVAKENIIEPQVKSMPPRRGRRNVGKVDYIEDPQETEEVKSTPAKRGRKNVAKEENLDEPQEDEEVKSIAPKRGRRNGAKEDIEELQEKKEVKSTPVKRGRRHFAKETPQEVKEDIEEVQEVKEVTAVAPRRGRRNVAKEENIDEPQEVKEVKVTPMKRGRRNIVKKDPQEVIEIKSTPPKRGRRNVAKVQIVEEPQETVEVKATIKTRGRRNVKENTEEQQEEKEVNSIPPKKGRKNVGKLENVKEPMHEDVNIKENTKRKVEEPVEQDAEPKTRARGKKVEFVLEEPVKKTRRLYSIEDSPVKVKRTRRN